MTSGSSQGLFVIVAVVIFGIFVMISYVLFRDNLKTGLASIFEDAIEETNKNIYPNVLEKARVRVLYKNAYTLADISKPIVLEYKGIKGAIDGVEISGSEAFKKGHWYRLTYKIKVLEGKLSRIAGHINSEDIYAVNFRNFRNFTINGENENDGFYFISGGNVNDGYAKFKQDDSYLVKLDVLASTDGFLSPKNSIGLWIQPDRMLSESNFKIEISNIHMRDLGKEVIK